MKARMDISILGLNGNPSTLLARATQLWELRNNPWGYGGNGKPRPFLGDGASFDEVVAHLEAECGFRCVDVVGKADHPDTHWDWMVTVQGFHPVSGETWEVSLQSCLRQDSFTTVRLDGGVVEAWCKDMMRSGLWHLTECVPYVR